MQVIGRSNRQCTFASSTVHRHVHSTAHSHEKQIKQYTYMDSRAPVFASSTVHRHVHSTLA